MLMVTNFQFCSAAPRRGVTGGRLWLPIVITIIALLEQLSEQQLSFFCDSISATLS